MAAIPTYPRLHEVKIPCKLGAPMYAINTSRNLQILNNLIENTTYTITLSKKIKETKHKDSTHLPT